MLRLLRKNIPLEQRATTSEAKIVDLDDVLADLYFDIMLRINTRYIKTHRERATRQDEEFNEETLI